MDQVLFKIAEILNLQTAPTFLDLGTVILILVLVFITGLNLFSSDSKKIETKIEKKTVENVVEEETESSKSIEIAEVKETISWEKRLFKGLSKTRSEVWGKIGGILGGSSLDEDMVEELEEILFTSDLSPALVDELLEELKKIKSSELDGDYLVEVKKFLKSKMEASQEKVNIDLYKFKKNESPDPKVIMIVGVNGAGKTTTIGKLATKLRSQGALSLIHI